ncbi:HIT-like domain containing protein [Rhypophila decipiens]
MAETAEDAEDFNPDSNASTSITSKKRNAFSELMAPKSKSAKPESGSTPSYYGTKTKPKEKSWRGNLLPYIQNPEGFPKTVIRVTKDTVLIQDQYPKATVHLLLLPRSPKYYDLHPKEAFKDEAFLSMMKKEAASAAKLAAAELSRKISRFSASDKARNGAMESLASEAEMPLGRDYLSEIRVGTHAHPSMRHLHVHIISRDMHSDCVKHRKHYNSFNTSFFVTLEDQPLADGDDRLSTSFQNANLEKDFVCWRCGKEFRKDKFADLKRHLDVEFELWKKE